MGLISDLKLDINNLKIQRFRAGENVRKIQTELDKNALKFEKEQTQLKTEIKALQLQCATQFTEPLRYCEVESKSDTEKENDCLRSELTDVVNRLEKSRHKYKDLEDRYESEQINAKRKFDSLQCQKNRLEQDSIGWNDRLDQTQSELNRLKNEQVLQQDSFKGKIDKLLHQNRTFESNNELLRQKVYTQENEMIKLEKDEAIQNCQAEINGIKKELKAAQLELLTSTREMEELSQQFKLEAFSGKAELDKLKDEKSDLMSVIKECNKDKEKMDRLERENTTLQSRYKNAKATAQDAEEIAWQLRQQMNEEKENMQEMCGKIKSLENEKNHMKSELRQHRSSFQKDIKTLCIENAQLNHRPNVSKNELSSLQKKIAEFEIRLQEKSKQLKALETSFQEGSSIDMSTLTDPNRPTRLGQRFIDLYENEWKDAMSELKESGGEKQNIDFLLNILRETYLFAESMVQRYLESFGKSLIVVNDNIQVNDGVLVKLNTDHIRTISKFLGLNMDKMFLSTFHARKYVKCGVVVQTFIKETVLLSWLMVTRSNPLVICTKVPAMFNPATCEPYSKNGSMVDYVVWPVLYLQEGEQSLKRELSRVNKDIKNYFGLKYDIVYISL